MARRDVDVTYTGWGAQRGTPGAPSEEDLERERKLKEQFDWSEQVRQRQLAGVEATRRAAAEAPGQYQQRAIKANRNIYRNAAQGFGMGMAQAGGLSGGARLAAARRAGQVAGQDVSAAEMTQEKDMLGLRAAAAEADKTAAGEVLEIGNIETERAKAVPIIQAYINAVIDDNKNWYGDDVVIMYNTLLEYADTQSDPFLRDMIIRKAEDIVTQRVDV